MNNTIVVTGANGFIGRNLCDRLSKYYRVVALSKSKPSRVVPYEFIACDISEPLPIRADLKSCKVVHCAAVISAENTQDFNRINVLGTKNLLDWCVKHEVQQVLYFSTGGVYGYGSGFSCETDLINPIGDYGLSKALGENLCSTFYVLHGIKSIIFRLYFPYCDGERSGIFGKIENSIKNKIPLTIMNGGAPRINPIHIDDLYAAVVAVLSSSPSTGVFNISGNQVYNFLEVVKIIEKKIGFESVLNYSGKFQGDLLGSNSLFSLRYDWRPTKNIFFS